jgi:uncharacterized protein (DUF952 family)
MCGGKKHKHHPYLSPPPIAFPTLAPPSSLPFLPSFSKDGFTHATAHAPFLLPVANHFYTGIKEPFLLLVIKPSLLTGQVKMEPAAPVGETEALAVHGEKEGGREEEVELFPHVYGGIPPKAVVGVLEVRRGEDGSFLGIL